MNKNTQLPAFGSFVTLSNEGRRVYHHLGIADRLEVVGYGSTFSGEWMILVDLGPYKRGHEGNGFKVEWAPGKSADILRGRCWWLEDGHYDVIESKPKAPSAPMDKAVLDLLKSKGAVTSIEAQGVLRCRSLSRRITSLRQLGWPIVRELKKDPTGQRYARYHLEMLAA